QQDAVALDARLGRDVVRLRVADQRVDQQTVDGLERALGQVLVRAVDRVASLEADDALPPALGEYSARIGRVERELREGRLRPLEDGDLASEVERLLRVEAGYAGVVLVGRAKRVPRLALLVVLEDLVDLERRVGRARFVGQRDLVALRLVIDREAD